MRYTWYGRTERERFFAKVERPDGDDGCWLWLGYLTDGYGIFKLADGEQRGAHRVSYEWLVGPIPEGLTLDHLCRNRACVNPDHLEPVTRRENILRGVGAGAQNAKKTHCKRGHEFTPENTYSQRPGWRKCRTCKNDAERARYHERRAAAA